MRQIPKDQFYDVLTVLLVRLSQEVDVKDPDNVVFSPDFDSLLRHIQSRPLGPLRTTYMKQSSETKMLYRQLDKLLTEKESIRVM